MVKKQSVEKSEAEIVTSVIGLDIQSFIDSLPMPVVLTDPEDGYRMIFANRFSEAAVGERLNGVRMVDLREFQKNPTLVREMADVVEQRKEKIRRRMRYDFNGCTFYQDNFNYPSFSDDVTEAVNRAEELRNERGLRDSFLSALGHDLTQPLYIIKAGLETLEKKTSDPDDKKLCVLGLTSLIRTETMIKNLLDAFYLGGAKSERLKLEEFKPCDVARTMVDVLGQTYGDRFTLQGKEIAVAWDRSTFTRILDNLLSNALKYGSPGSLILISFEQRSEEIELRVHNQGSYVAPEDREEIFKMYKKGKSAEDEAGWGIGFSIVKKLVEAHRGTVRIESPIGGGTRFIVTLPARLRAE